MKHVDVFATRGTQRLYAQKRNRTASVGLEVDTLYGQLLHRMPAEELGAAIFAGVAPIQRLWLLSVCRPRMRNPSDPPL